MISRFGMWDAILAESLPGDPELYCVTTALAHYAKGVALAASSRVSEAERERERFAAAVERVPATRYLFNNTALDILAIAAAMLDGEIEYRAGNHDAAWGHLGRAIELDDGLPYDEPWGWMQPTPHAYGALLLEQGDVETARDVYAADLGLTARPHAPASTATTSGASTATTSVSSGSAVPTRRARSRRSSTPRSLGRTSTSPRRASAA